PGFDNLKSGTKIKISVKGARSVKKTLTKKLIKNGGEIVVDLKTNRQAIESLDLLLTIDATGSMGDEMRYLQSELKAIVGRVEVANPGIDIRTGLIVYRDKGDAYIIREIPFTDDLEDFRKSLSEQNANGGGDTPEAMHLAMQAGLKMNWRKDALKVNLLVADAPPHDQYISDTWEAGLISRSRGIHIVPLAASGVDKTAEFLMRSMAQITGGRFLFLTDDSGIGNPHAEPSVDCYVVTRLDGLVTRVLSSLIKGERVEPEADDVIRSVGNYRSGICALESQEANVSPQNATLRDEQ
ncbi:MAG: VWA domain-containing protein, partial [Robiginitomaculum sp.]|nr:VWA domain-containing protein [Robiginitomaculum sp.]